MSLKFESEIRPINKILINDKRISRNVLTKFEKTSIIGKRANILSRGIKTLLKLPDNIDKCDYIKIAELELNAHLIPFIIRRKFILKNKEIVEEFNIYDDPDNKNIRCELIILKI
jgi:DNA-directed RNA polymerase subunit K/omega